MPYHFSKSQAESHKVDYRFFPDIHDLDNADGKFLRTGKNGVFQRQSQVGDFFILICISFVNVIIPCGCHEWNWIYEWV